VWGFFIVFNLDGSHVWRLVHGGERVGNDAVQSHDVTVQRP